MPSKADALQPSPFAGSPEGRAEKMTAEAKTDGQMLMDSINGLRGRVEVAAARKIDADKPGNKKPDPGGKYNAAAVQKAIDKDKRIKPAEAKAIHAVLKGWRKDDTKTDAIAPYGSKEQQRYQALKDNLERLDLQRKAVERSARKAERDSQIEASKSQWALAAALSQKVRDARYELNDFRDAMKRLGITF